MAGNNGDGNNPPQPGQGDPPPSPPPPPPPSGGQDTLQGGQGGQDTGQGGQGDPPPAPDWRDRRIGEQQARLRERNARIQDLERQLAAANGQQPPPPQSGQGDGRQPPVPGQPPFTPPGPQDIQRQINEEAQRLASQQEFNRRCNEVAEAGRRVYNNFDQRVQRLTGLVDGNDPGQVSQYNAFLSAAMETGQATRLIYDLGGDLNEASRIMALDPVKMAVELTRLSARATTTDQTGAPRPITPLTTGAQGQRAAIQPDDPDSADNLSTEEWMRRREEQIASRRQRTLG
jgi:hypothetical protein